MSNLDWRWVKVSIPVLVEQGRSGLCYVTSPLIKGLLVAEQNANVAVANVEEVVSRLGTAAMEAKDK